MIEVSARTRMQISVPHLTQLRPKCPALPSPPSPTGSPQRTETPKSACQNSNHLAKTPPHPCDELDQSQFSPRPTFRSGALSADRGSRVSVMYNPFQH